MVTKSEMVKLFSIAATAFTLLTLCTPVSALPTIPHKSYTTLELQLFRNPTNQRDAALVKVVRQAINNKDWSKVESLARQCDNDTHFSLKGFNDYSTFLGEIENVSGTNLEGKLALISEWMKCKPQSPYAPAAYASLMTRYAWYARGGGYASSVNAESWKLFHKRLADASTTLTDAASRGLKKTRGWYEAMFTVALGQSWERPRYDAFFKEATTAYPDYKPFYFYKAYWLLPRWHGKERVWEKFATHCADALSPAKGDEFYAQIVWFIQSMTGEDDIKIASLERLQRGFAAMEKSYADMPDVKVSSKSAMAKLALAYGDKKLARQLFDELGNKVSVYVWNYKYTFAEARKTAYAADE